MSDRDQQIRELAHAIWQQEGCPMGQADRHWAMAEAVEARERAQIAVLKNADGAPGMDAELQATFEKAAGLDTPERFPKIKSS